MCFAAPTAALKQLKSRRLELRGSLVRVKAAGGKKVWTADTDKGPRWISLAGGKWTVSKVAPGAAVAEIVGPA